MSHASGHRPFPRGALFGAAALIGITLVMVVGARVGGVGLVQAPQSAAVESRDLRFLDRADGAILVYDAGDDRTIDVLGPGTNGFVRGVMRSLARGRKLQEIGWDAPVRLTLWEDGRLSLEDPETGYRIGLEAFGPTNVAAFARFLSTPLAVN